MSLKDALDGEASMVSDLQQFYRSAKQVNMGAAPKIDPTSAGTCPIRQSCVAAANPCLVGCICVFSAGFP
jgi:hypothetical protein